MEDAELGRSIRDQRLAWGWRQSDLADASGMSRKAISRIERGDVGFATPDQLKRVVEALGGTLEFRLVNLDGSDVLPLDDSSVSSASRVRIPARLRPE